jgi:hypothetical protein
MARRLLLATFTLGLFAVFAGVADARGAGGGGGGGRRRAGKSARAATQGAAILDEAVRRDNVRRARLLGR